VPDVLIVQSDASIRAMLRATMELEGYACEEVENGISAWNLLRRCERTYVVLLSDMLPDLGWHDLLLVVARDTHGAGRHAYVVTSVLAEHRRVELASIPTHLSVALLPLPAAISTLPHVVATAARRLGLSLPPPRRMRTSGRPLRSSRPPRSPRPLTLRITASTAGPAAAVEVRTRAGAALTISVRYPSGRCARSSDLHGLRFANADGCCRWQWRLRTTASGSMAITVTAEWNGQQAQRTKLLIIGTARRSAGRPSI
jgi:CheY-like chemotaxis protein